MSTNTNNITIPTPKMAPFAFGGNPNQNAFLGSQASIDAQVARNQTLMGGKLKRRKSIKKRKSIKRKSNKKRKSIKKRKSSKKMCKRGGAAAVAASAVTIPVPILANRYPSSSAPSQQPAATQLLNAGNSVQSQLNSVNDKYATVI